MLAWALVSWWYSIGWLKLAKRFGAKLAATMDFFSIAALLKSLFAPYRQLSVGRVQGPVGLQLRAWADRQVSRGIGAIVRLAVIIFGAIATILMIVIALVGLLVWPLIPIMPLIAIVAIVGGVK